MLKLQFDRFRGLPREVRDTLFLLAVIGWVVALQTPHIPPWCLALSALLLGWRAQLTLGLRPLPGAWTRFLLLLAAIAATYFTHRTIVGRDAGVTLIVVLLALKTLELRARRDAFVVFFLSFFTLLTHFFYSQSLLTALGILLSLWGLLTALVLAHMPTGRPALWQGARLSASMALVGAPIMLVLFMLFPRMAPLWGIPGEGMTGRSGLSPTMSVGTIASLALDDSIVMRLRFQDRPPPQHTLYFRGPVLSRFDGRQWLPLASDNAFASTRTDAPQPLGEPTRYQATLEPSNRPWLLVMDAAVLPPTGPTVSARDLLQTADLQWLLRRPVTDLLRYEVQSFVNYRYGENMPPLARQAYLELPPGFNPRTLAMAQEMRQKSPDTTPQDLVEQALATLRNGGYAYTLDPGVYGEHTADEFWFARKAGFCEHIASGFVVLMRALDIPARLVTGYQGGEINSVDGYWTVRQSDAHAWTEVWLPDQGWVRVDPTSSVAPGRTGALQRLRPQPGLIGSAMLTVSPDMAARLRAFWEAANNGWNQWVLNYTQSRQFDLVRRLGLQASDWTDLLHALISLLVGAATVAALWTLWDRRRTDPWIDLLGKARRRLRQVGISAGPDSTPRQLASQLPATLAGGDQAALRAWLLALEAQRYGAAQTPDRRVLATLEREFKHLPWPSPTARP